MTRLSRSFVRDRQLIIVTRGLHVEPLRSDVYALMNLCNELLALAVARNAKRLDESVYLELTTADHRPTRTPATPARAKPARR